MTEAVRLPAPAVGEADERPASEPAVGGLAADPGGWVLMLVPATICLAMFVVAFWW
ncbi:MAG TPA: hypothetical protein VM428_06295 [Microlunatus sp.]|nr:hypothetical protein [Microlunatus sp.]